MKKIFILGAALFLWQSNSFCANAPQKAEIVTPAANNDIIVSPKDISNKGLARLRILSTPDSAAIVFDSLEKGITPLTLDGLAPGPHVVLVKKKGYFLKKINITLISDSLTEISVSLVRPGCIVVKTDPPGALVFIDNKESGITPYENSKLKPGAFNLRLEMKQHETIERSIIAVEAKCDTIAIAIPFSKAYTDSVYAIQKAETDKNRKFKRTVNCIVLGIFLVFGIVILGIEAGNAS